MRKNFYKTSNPSPSPQRARVDLAADGDEKDIGIKKFKFNPMTSECPPCSRMVRCSRPQQPDETSRYLCVFAMMRLYYQNRRLVRWTHTLSTKKYRSTLETGEVWRWGSSLMDVYYYRLVDLRTRQGAALKATRCRAAAHKTIKRLLSQTPSFIGVFPSRLPPNPMIRSMPALLNCVIITNSIL